MGHTRRVRVWYTGTCPRWSRTTQNYNIWKQTNNPTVASNNRVSGYEPISTPFIRTGFGGLKLLNKGNNGPCLMDAMGRGWWFAIGQTSRWKGVVTGPHRRWNGKSFEHYITG